MIETRTYIGRRGGIQMGTVPGTVIVNGNTIFVPRAWQFELMQALATIPQPGSAMTVTAMCHRSAGKSKVSAIILFLACLAAGPGEKAAFIAPHLNQARAILKGLIEDLAYEAGVDLKWDATDNSFTFPSGAILMFGATENNAHERLRGNRFTIGMVLDEAAFMGSALDALLPTLVGGDKEGWLLALGTPRSLGDPLAQLYAKGLSPEHPNHLSLRFSIYDTHLFNEAEIEQRRLSSPSELAWRREWLADPTAGVEEAVNSMTKVISARDRKMPVGGEVALSKLPKVMGIDPSRSAHGDGCIAALKWGNIAFPTIDLPSGDAVVTATAIASLIDRHQPDGVFMDAGGLGGPIVDVLNTSMGYDVTGVDFGSKAPDSGFANMRAWLWWQLREWIEYGALPAKDHELIAELTGPTWKTTPAGKIVIESKMDMKKRGLSSPDRADALALAVAFPVQKKHRDPLDEFREQRRNALLHRSEYDPYEDF